MDIFGGSLADLWDASGRSLEAPCDPLGPDVAIGLPSGQLELGGASSTANNSKRRCDQAFRLDEPKASVTKYRACAQKHAGVNPGSGSGHGVTPPTGPLQLRQKPYSETLFG